MTKIHSALFAAAALLALGNVAHAETFSVNCPNGTAAVVEWLPDFGSDGAPLLAIGTPIIVGVNCVDGASKNVHTIRGLPEVRLASGQEVNTFLGRAKSMLTPKKTAAGMLDQKR